MEEIKECIICKSSDFSKHIECNDYFLSNELFKIYRCNKCGLLFLNPCPDKKEQYKYYDSPEYISHSGTKKGIINFIYKIVRNYTLKNKYKIVTKYSKGKTILDIGSGSGELLKEFKRNKWITTGIEPNDNARKFSISTYMLNIISEEEINNLTDKSFDVITMWHVLEHVFDLNKRMLELKRLLKDDGVIFIAVPNNTSFDAEYYDKHWAAYDVPRHIYHFTPETMKKLLSKFNFTIIDILPMKLDSYYISMLSEKYKSGRNNISKAIYIGLKSNLKASKNKMLYSSLIYIVKNEAAVQK